jgi:hypothetical protein
MWSIRCWLISAGDFMLTGVELLAVYREQCKHVVTVRRYSGTGQARTKVDYTAAGYAQAYGTKELLGTIVQGDVKVIAIAADLAANGMTLPVMATDKVVVDGRELAIQIVKSRKSIDGVIVAYEVQARG